MTDDDEYVYRMDTLDAREEGWRYKPGRFGGWYRATGIDDLPGRNCYE